MDNQKSAITTCCLNEMRAMLEAKCHFVLLLGRPKSPS